MAGGVKETVALSVWPFAEAVVFSGGGALRGAAADLPPLGARGSVELWGASTPNRSSWSGGSGEELLKVKVMMNQIEDGGDEVRWRLYRAEFRDFPSEIGRASCRERVLRLV